MVNKLGFGKALNASKSSLIQIRGIQFLASLALIFGLLPLANAQIAGYNVIMVHGFKPKQLISPPTSESQIRQQGIDSWSDYWKGYADGYLTWNSAERIEGQNAVRLYEQAKVMNQKGLCDKGCIFVTHSTGDLVTRYFLDNQADWFESEGLNPLKVVAVLDFAGAGGGTELANTAIGFARSDAWWQYPARKAVELWLGEKLTPERLGVLYDLQPSVARQLSLSPQSVPRLRFIGGGSEFLGMTDWFISGWDDGVVPTHSSCGAVTADSFDSCSPNQTLDGKLQSSRAPASLMHNHYPILMGKDIHHRGAVKLQTGSTITLINNYNNGPIETDFDTTMGSKWGLFSTTYYSYIPNSDTQTMSEIVVNHLDSGVHF